jgi:hypothetical protein
MSLREKTFGASADGGPALRLRRMLPCRPMHIAASERATEGLYTPSADMLGQADWIQREPRHGRVRACSVELISVQMCKFSQAVPSAFHLS